MARIRYAPAVLMCAVGWAALPASGSSAPVPKEGTTPYVKWTVTEDPTNEMHEPLVVKDLVVVGTDKGELRAFRIDTGKPVWVYECGKRIYHRPSSDGDRVYFTAEGGLTTAVTADAGKKLWSFALEREDGPTLALREKGLVYVAGHDGTLYALDAKTGDKKWTADFATDAPPDTPKLNGARARFPDTKARPTALATDGEAVFLSVFDQGRVVAFNAGTGKRLWAAQADGRIFGTAVSTQTHLFIGSQDKYFYCLDKKTGKQVWKFQTKSRVESGCVVDDKHVYFGSCDGSVYCLSQADGKERWHFDTDRYPDGTKSSIYSVPVLRQGAVYFAAGEGQFYAITAETGMARARLRPVEKSEIYCSAATDGRSFFLTTRPSIRKDAAGGTSSLVAISLK